MHASPHLWQAQDSLRARGRKAVVAVESPFQPPAQTGPVDGCDDRDALLREDVEGRVPVHANLQQEPVVSCIRMYAR